jgi:hypothetical protein
MTGPYPESAVLESRARRAGKGEVVRGFIGVLLCGLALATPAVAAPVSGPHETVDSQLTTTLPGAPSGFHYTGAYHAAGDPAGDPPYMRRMVTYNPPGMRFDTGAAELCGASDLELSLRGAAACPAGSRLGGGTAQGSFMGRPSSLAVDFLNNTGEQIIVVRSPGAASVARGKLLPDGSVEFASPTCYPALSPPGCLVDNALQLGSDIYVPAIVRTVGGVPRAYLTTAPECPAAGHWDTPIRFWWSDGTVDTVVTQQACSSSR